MNELALAEGNLKVAELYGKISQELLPANQYQKYQLDLEKARLALDKAKERLANHEDSIPAQLALVELEREQAEIDLKKIDADLALLEVDAPQDGIIIYGDNWANNRKVQVGDTLYQRMKVLTLPDLSSLQVIGYVYDTEVRFLSAGMTCEFSLDAVPGRVWRGKIASLTSVATRKGFASQHKVFRAVIEPEAVDLAVMKPGMTVRVELPLALASRAIAIPREFLGVDLRGEYYVKKGDQSGDGHDPTREGRGLQLPAGADPGRAQSRRYYRSASSGGEHVMSRKSTVYLAVIILLASGILGFWLYRSSRSVALAAAAEKDLLTVTRADFPLIATAPGILEAPRSVSIGPPRVPRENRFRLARMVEEGKHVSEGDFLLEFDGSDLNRRLREDTANFQRVQEEYQKKRSDFDIQVRDLKLQLEQAKADLDKLENKLSRQAELESAIVIAETQIRRDMAKKKVELLAKKLDHVTESGRIDLQISRTNENHYRSRMDTLLDAIESLTVTSPVAGVVIYKRDWNNEPRQVGSYVFVLDTVLEIPDLSSMRAKVMVDEVDAGKVQVGQEARVLVDALQGRVFSGKVTSISAILKQAAFDRPQRIAEALVELQSSEIKQLRPGMSARAQIQVGRHSDVVVIPLASIQERNGQSLVQVWNAEKLTYDWQPVQLLTNDGVSAVISSGLQPGQRIRATPKA